MFADFRILTLGMATVVDTVLLLAMLRPANRRRLALWMALITGGAWLWHGGTFTYLLLGGATEFWGVEARWICMLLMTAGLLLMPSALMHGVTRLWQTGIAPAERSDPWRAAFYLPMLTLLPAAALLRGDPDAAYVNLLAPLVAPYALAATAINLISAVAMVRVRKRFDQPGAAQLGAAMAALLVAISFVLCFDVFAGERLRSPAREICELMVVLAPVAPVTLFAYYVVRFRFMSLILERTLAYGAIVVSALLVHHVATRRLAAEIDDRYHLDLAILEGAAVFALVTAYSPLRRRAAEGLRYLLGGRPERLRDETRRLAVVMSELAGRPPEELLAWFAEALVRALEVEYVAGWLFGDGLGAPLACRGATARLGDEAAQTLRAGMLDARLRFCEESSAPSPALAAMLERADASIAIVFGQAPVEGLLVIGRPRMQQQLAAEEISTLLLLVEQLAGAMRNSLLLSDRMLAERRALQNEKLSALGLLAGSIAHEVKNPLSSIKTIASVLSEQLGHDSDHAEDLRLILGEIDRLALTTAQLLDFSRPAADGSQGVFSLALERTLHVMRHVARERKVTIESPPDMRLAPIYGDEGSLREICFNLLANSIDAAGPGGRVTIACRQENGHVVAEFRDTGPGIPLETQDRLFEPFFTTKPDGTGLGLYNVARRVRELGGEIRCRSAVGQGTSFILTFPRAGEPS